MVHNLVHEEFNRRITDIYEVDEGAALGEGIQGIVRTITHKKTGVKYAMKTVPLGAGKDSRAMKQLRSEVDLIRRLDHPNIVRLQEVFETEETLFLVMDLCTGGDMMTRWERNRRLKYSEQEAATTVRKIVNAIRYCHEHHVVHRDVKLENILWEHAGPDAEPQLVDFGLGVTFSNDDEVFREDVGSLYYVAPEVLGRNYTKACDCWSIGVIAYMLLAGMPPFLAPSDEGVKLKIKWAKVGFSKETFGHISDEAKDFIKRLMAKAPYKRMTAEQACAHPWLANSAKRSASGDRSHEEAMSILSQPTSIESTDTALDPGLIRRLTKFQEYGVLKRVAFGVVAHALNPEEIRKLRAEFQKVDKEGRGEIRPSDLANALKTSGTYSEGEVARMFEPMDVDHDGKIGFTEFLAASLTEGQLTNDNLRLAFDRLDTEHTGEVTLENLIELTGATVEETDLKQQITDEDLKDALLGTEGGGVSYEVFRRVMVKNFSKTHLNTSENITKLVRAASKLSIQDLAVAMDGTEEEAKSIITTSNMVLNNSGVRSDEPAGDLSQKVNGNSDEHLQHSRRDSAASTDSASGIIHF